MRLMMNMTLIIGLIFAAPVKNVGKDIKKGNIFESNTIIVNSKYVDWKAGEIKDIDPKTDIIFKCLFDVYQAPVYYTQHSCDGFVSTFNFNGKKLAWEQTQHSFRLN